MFSTLGTVPSQANYIHAPYFPGQLVIFCFCIAVATKREKEDVFLGLFSFLAEKLPLFQEMATSRLSSGEFSTLEPSPRSVPAADSPYETCSP